MNLLRADPDFGPIAMCPDRSPLKRIINGLHGSVSAREDRDRPKRNWTDVNSATRWVLPYQGYGNIAQSLKIQLLLNVKSQAIFMRRISSIKPYSLKAHEIDCASTPAYSFFLPLRLSLSIFSRKYPPLYRNHRCLSIWVTFMFYLMTQLCPCHLQYILRFGHALLQSCAWVMFSLEFRAWRIKRRSTQKCIFCSRCSALTLTPEKLHLCVSQIKITRAPTSDDTLCLAINALQLELEFRREQCSNTRQLSQKSPLRTVRCKCVSKSYNWSIRRFCLAKFAFLSWVLESPVYSNLRKPVECLQCSWKRFNLASVGGWLPASVSAAEISKSPTRRRRG